MNPKTYIVLVNWNGWQDTLQCIKSILRLTGCDFQIIVCDNHSADDSLSRIRSYLSRKYSVTARRSSNSKFHPKLLSRIEGGGILQLSLYENALPGYVSRQLTLIQAKFNFGFAGGNNIGISFALSAGDADYVWLLNNDTIVSPQALSAMVERMKAVPDAGICGSTILYPGAPQRIQSLGGARYLKWAGVGVQLGLNKRWPIKVDIESIEKEMSYVSGASMLVSREFLEAVGQLEESYFLYFEEIDWIRRAGGRFKLVYAPSSIVYHKEGGSIASSQSGRSRSPQSFFWLSRSRLKFTAKFYPEAVPSVMIYSLMNCLQWALVNRNPYIFLAGVKGCISGSLSHRKTWCTH